MTDSQILFIVLTAFVVMLSSLYALFSIALSKGLGVPEPPIKPTPPAMGKSIFLERINHATMENPRFSIERAILLKVPLHFEWETENFAEILHRHRESLDTTCKGMLMVETQVKPIVRLNKTVYHVTEIHEPYEDETFWDGQDWVKLKTHYERKDWHNREDKSWKE